MLIAAYVGARPLGRPLPPLAEVPQHPALPLHLIYAFARDADRDGRFEFYDPWQLDSAVAQQCAWQRGMLSLGGAGYVWGPSVGLGAWVAAAADSLRYMLDKYRLVGLDINVEEGLDTGGGFPEAMAALVAQLKAWRPRLLVTVSPYGEVWSHYRRLLQVRADLYGDTQYREQGCASCLLGGLQPCLSLPCNPSTPASLPACPRSAAMLSQLAGPSIDRINWQLYADLESPAATAEQVSDGAACPFPSLVVCPTWPQAGSQPACCSRWLSATVVAAGPAPLPCRPWQCTSGWLGSWAATGGSCWESTQARRCHAATCSLRSRSAA